MAEVVFVSASRAAWGAESSLVDVATGLARLGTEVVVLTASEVVADRIEKAEVGIIVRKLVVWTGSRVERVLLGARAALSVRPGGTLVLWDENFLVATLLLKPILRKRRVDVVIDLHNSFSGWKSMVIDRKSVV